MFYIKGNTRSYLIFSFIPKAEDLKSFDDKSSDDNESKEMPCKNDLILMLNKSLDKLSLSYKEVCDEVNEKFLRGHTTVAQMEEDLLVKLENLFDTKVEMLAEKQVKHDNEDCEKPLKVNLDVFRFASGSRECEEALSEIMGLCSYRICIDTPFYLIDNNKDREINF